MRAGPLTAIAIASLLAACSVRATSTSTVEAPPDPVLLESFDYAWARIAEVHPYEDMKGLDWEGVREKYRPGAERSRTVKDVRGVIAGMLRELGESHYAVFPATREVDSEESEPPREASTSPGRSAEDPSSAPQPSSAPETPAGGEPAPSESDADSAEHVADAAGEVGLEIRLVDGAVVVSRVLSDGPGAQAGIQPGWTVTKIGSRDVDALIAALPARLREGPGATLMVVHSLANKLAGRAGTTVTIEAGPGDDQRRIPLVRRVIGTTARFGHFPPISVRLEDRLLAEGRVGYIGFNVFMPVIAARFADALSAQREAGIEALIIDLRGNPGGLAGMVMGLSGWIVGDRAAALGVMKMRQAELRFIVNPRARNDRFHGPVAILVDGLSASTSELFAAGLQELGRAVVVGETSAGMSLPSVIEALPDGDLLQLVTADLHTPGGARIEGVGVTPDVVVSLDTESLLAGGDAQIAAAVAHLLHSSEPAPASPPETP